MTFWRRLLLVLVLGSLLGLGALALGLVRGNQTEVKPTPEPRLVYTALAGATTTVYAASAVDPSYRQAIARIEHRLGYGLRASLSPDGSRLAFTYLPPNARDPATEASLAVLDAAAGSRRDLLRGVDLRSALVWAPDGRSLACRRVRLEEGGREQTELWIVDTASGQARLAVSEKGILGLYPFAWSDDGRLYYSRVDPGGTKVAALNPATGQSTVLLHASDGVARSFSLSPDGTRLAFAAPQQGASALCTIVIATIADTGLLTITTKAQGYPALAWRPDGSALTFAAADKVEGPWSLFSLKATGATVETLSSASEGGFDLPLGWSPEGRYLAVRSFRGTPQAPAAERLAVIDPQGKRREVGAAGEYCEFIGWLRGS